MRSTAASEDIPTVSVRVADTLKLTALFHPGIDFTLAPPKVVHASAPIPLDNYTAGFRNGLATASGGGSALVAWTRSDTVGWKLYSTLLTFGK